MLDRAILKELRLVLQLRLRTWPFLSSSHPILSKCSRYEEMTCTLLYRKSIAALRTGAASFFADVAAVDAKPFNFFIYCFELDGELNRVFFFKEDPEKAF